MVLLYNKRKVRLHFLAPDTGGGSGDGKTASGQSQEAENPFKGLPWDELDDTTKASLKAAEATYIATLQEVPKLKGELEKATGLAKSFQSDKDRLQAERDKLAKKQKEEQPDEYVEALTQELLTAGYDQKQADALAPVFGNMFKKVGAIQRKEIGKELQPMGAAVLGQTAQTAFQTAMQNDKVGIFQTPEVQQKVWDFVVDRTKAGHETTPEIVANLGAMAFVEHVADKRAKGEEIELPKPTNTPPVVPGMTMPQFTFPGSSLTPIATVPRDPNAAKTALDPDTRAALATSFKAMAGETGIVPKAFKDILTPRRRVG